MNARNQYTLQIVERITLHIPKYVKNGEDNWIYQKCIFPESTHLYKLFLITRAVKRAPNNTVHESINQTLKKQEELTSLIHELKYLLETLP